MESQGPNHTADLNDLTEARSGGPLPPELCRAFNSAWDCFTLGTLIHNRLCGDANKSPDVELIAKVAQQLWEGFPECKKAIYSVEAMINSVRNGPARFEDYVDTNAHLIAL